MVRGLKVALFVYGVLQALLGIAFIFVPVWVGTMFGFTEVADLAAYLVTMLGGGLVAAAFLLILTGLDPLGNTLGLKFAIVWSALGAVTQLYSMSQGIVSFGQAGVGTILDAIFALIFLFLYPWRQEQTQKT